MSDRELEERLAELVRLVVGQQASRVELGVGTFIDVDFGVLSPTDPPGRRWHGEWHLWVYSAAWRIDHGSRPLGGSLDDEETMQRAVHALIGQVLLEVVVGPGQHWTFQFGNATTLHLFASNLGSEYWILFTPDGDAVSVGPGDSIRFGPADS